jgi:hypothetical protein
MGDSDFEDDFEDDFFEELKRKRLEELKTPKPIEGYLEKKPSKGIIPDDIYNRITQSFLSKVDGKCIASITVHKYVKTGSEINEALRQNRRSTYSEIISCLDKLATPLMNLLPRDFKDNFVSVYRQTYQPYNQNIAKGYTSTSNKPLSGFGSFQMKIFIPITTKVLLANISQEVGETNVFEIILPRETNLAAFARNKKTCRVYYYITATSDSVLDEIMKEVEREEDVEFI